MRPKQRRWTIKEVEFMRLMYPTEPAKNIAVELGTTYKKVEYALRRYGISKPGRKKHQVK